MKIGVIYSSWGKFILMFYAPNLYIHSPGWPIEHGHYLYTENADILLDYEKN